MECVPEKRPHSFLIFGLGERTRKKPSQFLNFRIWNMYQKKALLFSLQFHSAMRTDLSGFYISYYNNGGVRKKVASTFFSPISARTSFPCFDEPMFKANFTLRYALFYDRQLSCLRFSLRFLPKIRQLLCNCPASDWTFSLKKYLSVS